MVIWIIGLPGSGKTTLAKKLQKEDSSLKILHIDGDDMRTIWGEDIGYTLEDRKKNSLRIQKLSKIFEQQGFTVVVSIMSIFEEHRIENRSYYDKYLEVFLDVPINILKTRRTIYQDAIEKKITNVVGIDIPYDKPKTSDIVFKNNTLEDIVLQIKKVINV
ncbi:adenylyl-sulfate kinase [Arcobacter sp. F155]|uniref:adenylyl-sulfate kinase n=1 Tax=Arcobacter sp. F155 TaxID=2044512 RepID=UPI00100C2FD1|nr:adenylyl-sulfate kinase [Arcobacter sp. F155]RXJ77282.1 adenylyl-sulfate kinase [Arcobacter sp. F155]